MKVTMTNKDHIARLIAEKAFTLPMGGDDDIRSNNMLRVSEALETVGEIGSSFRTLNSLTTEFIPCGEIDDTGVTYAQALVSAMEIAEIV